MRRGLLAGAALALMAAGCTLPGSVRGPIEVTAIFDDVGDLVVNHSVQTADVRIGSVTKIELTEDYRAKVTLSIKDVGVPRNVIAVLRSTSLLGEKFIDLQPQGDPAEGPFLADDDVLETDEAPELEFVAEQAVEILAAVTSNDLAILVETGAVGFGDRGPELRGLIEDLGVISATLADQTGNIVAVIDGLDQATATLAAGAGDLDGLLVNLVQTTQVLVENRDQAIATLRDLTRLVSDQNRLVFEPYLDAVDLQVKQLDAILQRVAAGREEVGLLIDWIDQFVHKVPVGIPRDFALVYGWFDAQPLGLDGAQ